VRYILAVAQGLAPFAKAVITRQRLMLVFKSKAVAGSHFPFGS
jgi:hypothetical protein